MNKKTGAALISVYHKDGLDELVKVLIENKVTIYSTGGTLSYLEQLGAQPVSVESLTSYPSILGGRVKTLHPKVFGGILGRRDLADDIAQLEDFEIPELDLVVVDLYPFAETVANSSKHEDIIEKIDIGGISLIRAAAKNYAHVTVVPSMAYYSQAALYLREGNGKTTLEQRKTLAGAAFGISSNYDNLIGAYLRAEQIKNVEVSPLRYGENPHQQARFEGNLQEMFTQHSGKQLSYNNLLDVDAAIQLISDFDEKFPTVAVIKHNNACGLAVRKTLEEAYNAALAGDPVSAFGGIIVCNQTLDVTTANLLHELFFEVLIAPKFEKEALEILAAKKNRILLEWHKPVLPNTLFRSALNGKLIQERDNVREQAAQLKCVTTKQARVEDISDLLMANVIVKHTKSNAIVLVKNKQLIGSGTGQTSRVDALEQAIAKAKKFGFEPAGAAMASDAFFPFPDCVEIAHSNGILSVIQPGGSIKDQLSVDFCNANGMAMVFTGNRHFKH